MEVEVEPPHVDYRPHADRHWADFAIPGAALLISLISIAIALHHGKVMESLVQQNERLVQANSLPYVELAFGNFGTDVQPRSGLMAVNSGVGPAEVRSVSVSVDGRPVSDFNELLEACCGGKADARIASSTLLNRMIQAGQSLEYVIAFGPAVESPPGKALIQASATDRIVTSICYCSVFEECWVNSSSRDSRPRRVAACPIPAVQYRS
jgi:hypothetical protein